MSFVTEKICFDIYCGDKFSDDMFCMGSAQVKENLSSHILEIKTFLLFKKRNYDCQSNYFRNRHFLR